MKSQLLLDNSDLSDLRFTNPKTEETYSGFGSQKWSKEDMLFRLLEVEYFGVHKFGLRHNVELLMEQRRLLEDIGIIPMPIP